jgi:rfaE bifunctional protein nucleotidyltransferase chain/domain
VKSKIKSIEQLEGIVEELKLGGQSVVFSNGCFDILHVGHIRYLEEAKKLGDVLIIGLNSDSSTRLLKGENRPIMDEKDRAEVLCALECIDYVTIFSDKTPETLIERLKPDIHVKGGDYRLEDLPEKDVVMGYGGKVILLDVVEGKSTKLIIERIKKRYCNSGS